MNVSIVMPYRRRPQQLALTLESYRRFYWDDLPELVLVNDDIDPMDDSNLDWPAPVVLNTGRSDGGNPGRLFNLGVQHARHDVIALTNPECVHVANMIANWEHHARTGQYVVFGCRPTWTIPESLDALLANPENYIDTSQSEGWYQHSKHANRLFHEFSLISRRDFWDKVGGFSEEFTGYGYEDHDFVEKIMKAEIPVMTVDQPCCYHIWHERTKFEPTNEKIFRDKWGQDNLGRVFG